MTGKLSREPAGKPGLHKGPNLLTRGWQCPSGDNGN